MARNSICALNIIKMGTAGLVILVLISLAKGSPLSKICEPGTVTRVTECNHCFCTGDGTSEACTRKYCANPDDPDDDEISINVRETRDVTNESIEFRCVPGGSFQIECNTCTCGPDGRDVACTLMACPDWHSTPRSTDNSRNTRDVEHGSNPYHCTPGETFKMDCNLCICSPSGQTAGCTLMACPHLPNDVVAIENLSRKTRDVAGEGDSFRCTPGERYQPDACNWCTCMPDGRNAACTLMGCMEVGENSMTKSKSRFGRDVTGEGDSFRCTPGERYQPDACNWCTCMPDGRNAACTLMGCMEVGENSMTDSKSRIGRDVTGEGDSFRCTPGERYQPDGCNWCTCMPDGRNGACTLMAC